MLYNVVPEFKIFPKAFENSFLPRHTTAIEPRLHLSRELRETRKRRGAGKAEYEGELGRASWKGIPGRASPRKGTMAEAKGLYI